MYALEISKSDGKQTVHHAVPGRLLGYGGRKSIFLYKSDLTGEICRATHATFDEANLDAPEHELTPSERAIWNAISHTKSSSPATYEIVTPPKSLKSFAEANPFVFTTKVSIPIKCTTPHLGIKLESDPISRRNVIVDVIPN